MMVIERAKDSEFVDKSESPNEEMFQLVDGSPFVVNFRFGDRFLFCGFAQFLKINKEGIEGHHEEGVAFSTGDIDVDKVILKKEHVDVFIEENF